jgi:hypothetical protein
VKVELREHIAELADQRFGWDGDDALPIRPDVKAMALNLFGDHSWVSLKGVSGVHATLNEDGAVEVVIEHEGRELVLTLQCHMVVTYIRAYPGGATEEGTIRDLASRLGVSELQYALDWVKRGV